MIVVEAVEFIRSDIANSSFHLSPMVQQYAHICVHSTWWLHQMPVWRCASMPIWAGLRWLNINCNSNTRWSPTYDVYVSLCKFDWTQNMREKENSECMHCGKNKNLMLGSSYQFDVLMRLCTLAKYTFEHCFLFFAIFCFHSFSLFIFFFFSVLAAAALDIWVQSFYCYNIHSHRILYVYISLASTLPTYTPHTSINAIEYRYE